MSIISAFNTLIETGEKFTTNAYHEAWFEGEFWKASKNTIIVTVFVVSISLFLGTLGAYALSRSTEKYAFWILMAALIFRAMPHITLVSGYLFPFFELQIWGILPTTIVVLVAINQPFTLWLLYSFFKTIPKELDESALIDGCSYFQAFRHIIMPVMWPGVITAGLFSLMLAIGPQNIFVIEQGLKKQHIFLVCSVCTISDTILIFSGIFLFHYFSQYFNQILIIEIIIKQA